MTFIYVVRHRSDGVFRIYKKLGPFPEPKDRVGIDFATREDARAYAEQLKAEAGGPDKAEIVEVL